MNKITGLMFSNRESSKALMFEFRNPVKISLHSFFVFFPFLVLWINSRRQIFEIQVVKPWKFSVKPRKKFTKLVEIPLNKKYFKEVKFLVGKAKDL